MEQFRRSEPSTLCDRCMLNDARKPSVIRDYNDIYTYLMLIKIPCAGEEELCSSLIYQESSLPIELQTIVSLFVSTRCKIFYYL